MKFEEVHDGSNDIYVHIDRKDIHEAHRAIAHLLNYGLENQCVPA